MDKYQWCVKASKADGARYVALAEREGLTVPELMRRGLALYELMRSIEEVRAEVHT